MSSGDIFSFISRPVFIPPGTVSGFTVGSGFMSVVIKYFSGGSLEIGGSTLAPGNGYLISGSEVLSFDLRGSFYLAATGATVTAYILYGKSEGT